MNSWKKVLRNVTATTVALQVLMLSVTAAFAAEGTSKVKLRIMETTDLHVNMVNYDYYGDKETDEYGFAKTASLIKAARAEVKNSVLIDNGDLIQGNPLGDYVARIDPLKEGEVHPVFKAMNLLDYDAGNIGNHEFNYGLDFLEQSLAGANFPYINANVYIDDGDLDESNDQNYFEPYLIIDKQVTDESGKEHTLKVGVIGFVPPQIMLWDKPVLSGKVIAKDIIETANKFIPQMKKEGADVIIAVPHSGFEDIPQTDLMENSVLYLSKVAGIDAILFGHAHKVFPSADFEGKNGVDLVKGTIHGVPAVEPGYWGNHLGIIDLELEQQGETWKVIDSAVKVQPIYDAASKQPLVEADQAVIDVIEEEHDHTLDYIRGPVGKTTAPINSYFALVQDDPSIQIVTNAQKWYVEKHMQGTEYEGLPVLSAGAPFKAGGRSGASYYTNIPEGTIAIKNVADLYVYPNTVYAVKLSGAEVKEWLEWSAGQFNYIDTSKQGEQELINTDFPTYNFDVIDGLQYQIDVTQKPKYDAKGNVVNASSSRVVNLQYNGQPLDLGQQFIVATNNYRASTNKLANPDGNRIVLSAPDENRQVIIDYIRESGTINPSADENWSLAPISKKLNVTFLSTPAAKEIVAKNDVISYVGEAKEGFAKYSIHLANIKVAVPGKPNEAVKPGDDTIVTTKPVLIYTVKKGDNLYRIGLRHGVDWTVIAKINGINDVYGLQVGQKLRIQ